MSFNTFGRVLRLTTWGESHGPAVGCVLDGCPSGIALSESDIQPWLDKRRPGQSRFTTQRREADQVRILSGTFEGETTGTPISLLIENTDQRERDYSDIKDKFRPSHADYTYHVKYGVRDYRGGGRSSARETALRVAAGAVARKILGPDIAIRAAVVQIGDDAVAEGEFDWREVENNPLFCPSARAAKRWEKLLDETRKDASSVGALTLCIAEGAPAGLGAPVYAKLDADLAAAMMSINAAKGVEIGSGFRSAAMRGEESADEMRAGAGGRPEFLANNAGGILGGISSGQDIVCRIAFKPTSSIPRPVRTVNIVGEETDITTKGRHDPCVGIRAVPVAEAMMALVLADHLLLDRAQCGARD